MPTEDIRFDSADYPEDQAFDEYVQLYSLGADVRRGSRPFRAVVRGWRLDGILIFDRHLASVEHNRMARASQDGFDHIVASLVVSGSLRIESGGIDLTVSSGEIAFLDTRRGGRNMIDAAHIVTAAIARDLVEAAVGNAGTLHGTVLSPPESLFLADYMTSLVVHAPYVAQLRNGGYARALAEILSATLVRERDAGADVRRRDYLRRQAAERAMDAAIDDPALTSTELAERTGLSRSTLYRLFDKQGGVTQALVARRVDAVRQALEGVDGVDFDALIARFGFTDRGQMERAFERVVGQSIDDYRASVMRSFDDPADTSLRRWRGWFTELT